MLLPAVLLCLLQLYFVQNFLKTSAVNYLEKKLHTKVAIAEFRMTWFSALTLKGVSVEDHQHHKLFYSGELIAHYDLLPLLRKKLVIYNLQWRDVQMDVYRLNSDTAFNYQFIMDAFGGNSGEPDTLASAGDGFQYAIDSVQLKTFHVQYHDNPGGVEAGLSFDSIGLQPGELNTSSMRFTVHDLFISGLNTLIRIRPSALREDTVTAGESVLPFLSFDRISIWQSQVLFDDSTSGLATTDTIGSLVIHRLQLDLGGHKIMTDSLMLTDTYSAIRLGAPSDTISAPASNADTTSDGYLMHAGQLTLHQTRFRLDNVPAPPSRYRNAMDYNHLWVDTLEVDIHDIAYEEDTLWATVKNISFREKSGFTVKQFHSQVRYDPSEISLDDLLLVTNNSYIADTLRVEVPSWSTMADHLDELALDCNLSQCRIDMGEALYFVPDLAENPSLKQIFRKKVRLDTRLRGTLAELQIPRFAFSDQDGNVVELNGHIQNVSDPDKILADLDIRSLQSGNRGIRSWIPSGLLPEKVNIPRSITINGPIKASQQILQTDLHIRTSDGNLLLKADLQQYMDSLNARYHVAFHTDGLPIGKWIGDTTMGRLATHGMLKGKGWVLQRMTDTLALEIPLLEYNHYAYHDLSLHGSIAHTDYALQASSKDTAVTFGMQFEGSVDSLRPFLSGEVTVDKLDLFATHWYDEPLTVQTGLRVRLDKMRPYHLSGTLDVDSLQLAIADHIVALDTIQFQARDSLDQQWMFLTGPFGKIQAEGYYDYTTVYKPLGDIIGYHLQSPDSLAVKDTVTDSQNINLAGSIVWPVSLQSLMPELALRQPVQFTMHANTDSFLLSSHIDIPALTYGDFAIDTLQINMGINRDSLTADLDLFRLRHPQFPLEETRLQLSASRGLLHSDLTLMDQDHHPKYFLGAELSMLPDKNYIFKLSPNLLLNKQKWQVPEDNAIAISAGQLKEAHLSLSHDQQQLSIATEHDTGSVPAIQLTLQHLDLSALTSLMATNDTALVDGTANGRASVRNWDQSPEVNADLHIDSLRLMNALVGDLSLNAANNTPDVYTVNMALKSDSSNIQLQGTYSSKSDQALDFKLQLQPLYLPILEPLMMGYVNQLSGVLQGDMTIRGSLEAPRILGNLAFKNAGFNATFTNSLFHLYDEHITFEQDGVHLKDFVLSDSVGNEAVLNGSILTRDYRRYRFNLNLVTDNFKALGYQQSADQMIYGPAYIDSKVSIRGTPDLPRINMNLKLREKSEVTFAIPEEEPGIADREGVIAFVDPNHPQDSSFNGKDTIAVRTRLKGIEFSGNLEVTPDASLRIIIDRQNGDNLLVKGAATLNTTMDAGGNFLLTGQYQIQQGKYEMSLNQFIKRSFDIQKGSTITWEGEATDAQVNITAMYLANAPAIDLVSDQLSNATPEMRTRYKQKLPIQVYLIIKGEMMKPEISFRLDMPEDHQGDLGGTAYTRLKQINLIPSELNKQVMGLLVLNSFIPDNPMDIVNNGSGGGLEQVAAQSVSKILSQQLNNLAASLIKGVDVNFDLQSQQDYSTGNAQNSTTLNVGVSKHLFNDRLTVSVGNDFSLEGNNEDASGIAGNVSVEYTLTKDGRYRLRAYRKNNNEEIIQGQVIETGLTFSLVMDYNKFREIFAKVKKEEKLELRKKKK